MISDILCVVPCRPNMSTLRGQWISSLWYVRRVCVGCHIRDADAVYIIMGVGEEGTSE